MSRRTKASDPEPTRAVEDYLKAVYKLGRDGEAVSTSALAEELGRTAASVTNMVKALAEKDLLEHVPYHGVRLTEEGETAALRIIRRHRILESYLIERLGYTWDGVHAEAERLEHAASDELVDRMARALGDPSVDPHGAPIPSSEGEIAERAVTRLDEIPPGAPAVVREVADDDPERLRRAGRLGLVPGTRVVVCEGAVREGRLEIRVGGKTHVVDVRLAGSISVERL